MVKLYVKKITEGAINPATGAPWTIDDVPEKWMEEVREALENGGIPVPEKSPTYRELSEAVEVYKGGEYE